ncbi:MAG TPA: hypothetical protein VL598_03755 [Trinickia sp.]|uniref:hypothetical protein n=1 Tax=Trinickia sp. TaxID=2571163 RepID=UPI002CAEFA03|nr:hypothetical protein [Trinickia sp.]HTI16758.1 hypothetical protein [Trinickia sp.]
MSHTALDERGNSHDWQAHVSAYNMAFEELGLRFRWDAKTLAALASIADEAKRIIAYIEAHHPHLLTAYTAEFLSQAILSKKNAQRPEPLPIRETIAAETKRPSAVQVRTREMRASDGFSGDFALPMLGGA